MSQKPRINTRWLISRFLLLLVLASIIGHVLAATESNEPTSKDTGHHEAPVEKRTDGQKTAPVRDYKPSEKVSADKAVSFPTDI